MTTGGSGDTNGTAYPLVHVGPAVSDGGDDAPPARTGTERAARTWALACHLSPFAAWAFGIPGLVGPLVVWLIKRDEIEAVDRHGREAFNFQLTLLIAQFALTAFGFVTFGLGLILAVPLILAIQIAGFVLMVLAAIRANEGRTYRYPWTWRVL